MTTNKQDEIRLKIAMQLNDTSKAGPKKFANNSAAVDYTMGLINSEVLRVLSELEEDITHRVDVVTVQGFKVPADGQYIKVPNILSAIQAKRKEYM